jgi:hypothetical protein
VIDLAWMRLQADAIGLQVSDEDLEGIRVQLVQLKATLARSASVDLTGTELPLSFDPGEDAVAEPMP